MEGYNPMSEEEIEVKRLKEKEQKKRLRKKGKLEKNVQIGNLFYDLNTKE